MAKRKAASTTDDAINYKTIPALAAYIDRVGAEQVNFRRFMIKIHSGHYYHERALIRITPDREIICNNEEFAPTKEEVTEIAKALADVSFPKSIIATPASLTKLKTSGGHCYEFYDRKSGGIVMAQERVTFADGRKAYLPWTFWSDGQWRRMEPDGALPFYKPKKATGLGRIMIHEGAKSAEAAARVGKDHPWFEILAKYEHWGLIGGALAPHRADYGELKAEKPVEVVYICDNDYEGKSALTKVSHAYGGPLKGVMFDGRWPHSWDVADPLPPKFFSKGGRYTGPMLDAMMQPATWATEEITNNRGRPSVIIRKDFLEEWRHCVTPEVFVHRDHPNRLLTANEFNNYVSPFSDTIDTARLVKKDAAGKTATLRYIPSQAPGIYNESPSGCCINTHQPTVIKAEKGNPQPWLDFMEHLVTEPADRKELLRWCATLIARPDIRMLYGVLMISETQGIGKGTLGERILAPLVGRINSSCPGENEIVESNFNYWLAHKRLAVVHEIYAGHSAKAYNRLKSYLTDTTITVSKKYMANYEIDNWLHVFACSNSMRALRLEDDDRRWFVPKLTETKKSFRYWEEFFTWLEWQGGLEIIKWWASEFLKTTPPVMKGEPAPWSALKREVIEEGYSAGQALVANLLDAIRAPYVKAIEAGTAKPETLPFTTDLDLVNLIKDVVYEGRASDRLERPLTIRKVAKARGWHIGKARAYIKSWPSTPLGARIIALDPGLTTLNPGDLAKKKDQKGPINVLDFYNKLEKM